MHFRRSRDITYYVSLVSQKVQNLEEIYWDCNQLRR